MTSLAKTAGTPINSRASMNIQYLLMPVGICHKVFRPSCLSTEHLMVVRRFPTDRYLCSGNLRELSCWFLPRVWPALFS